MQGGCIAFLNICLRMIDSSSTFSKLNKFKKKLLNGFAVMLYNVLLGIIKAILVSTLAKSFTLIRKDWDISLFEIGNSNEYIAVFIDTYYYNPTYLTIKKFQINSLNYESDFQIQNEIIKTEKIQAYYNRIVSAFRLDIPELIVVVYIHSDGNSYLARFYNDNLERQGNDENDFILENNVNADNNIFVKGIGVNGEYAAFAYFKSNSIYSLVFNLRKYKNYYTFDSPLFYHEIN